MFDLNSTIKLQISTRIFQFSVKRLPEKRENRKGWKRDGRRWEATEKEGCIAEPDAGTKRGEPIYRHAM